MCKIIIMITVIPHRVPSPREIVMHTQSIIQNVLIKKKLEEQRENYRKRQDQQQQQQQQQQQIQQRSSSPVNSPAKQTMSPTPLAFTPTSVLRKMTADKEPDGANQFNQTTSIPAAIDGNSNRPRMPQDRLITPANLSKFPRSVDQVQNETLKMIFLHSTTVTNCASGDTVVDPEESALKTKYLCPLEHKQDTDDNNSNASATKEESVILDMHANENDHAKAASSSVIDENYDTNNNNSFTSLDEVLKTSSSEQETLVDETDKATASGSLDEIENPLEIENVDSQSTATPLAILENV